MRVSEIKSIRKLVVNILDFKKNNGMREVIFDMRMIP